MRGRRGKGRRKPKPSEEDLRELAYGLNKIGDMYVMMGEIEKEVGDLEKLMRKLARSNPLEIFSAIDADPELLAKVESFATILMELAPIMEKDSSDMSPDEKIEAGKGLKEMSSLFMEVAESIEKREGQKTQQDL